MAWLAAGFKFVDIQNIVDEQVQPVGIVEGDPLHLTNLVGVVIHQAAGEQPQAAFDGSDRRAHFVADYRYELLLYAFVLFTLRHVLYQSDDADNATIAVDKRRAEPFAQTQRGIFPAVLHHQLHAGATLRQIIPQRFQQAQGAG